MCYNYSICLHNICNIIMTNINDTIYSAVIIVINLASVCIACGVIAMVKRKSPTTVKLSGSYISWLRLDNQARQAQPVKNRLIEILAG